MNKFSPWIIPKFGCASFNARGMVCSGSTKLNRIEWCDRCFCFKPEIVIIDPPVTSCPVCGSILTETHNCKNMFEQLDKVTELVEETSAALNADLKNPAIKTIILIWATKYVLSLTEETIDDLARRLTNYVS